MRNFSKKIHIFLLFFAITSKVESLIHESIYDGCNTEFKFCIPSPDDEPCIEQQNCNSLATVQKKGKIHKKN